MTPKIYNQAAAEEKECNIKVINIEDTAVPIGLLYVRFQTDITNGVNNNVPMT